MIQGENNKYLRIELFFFNLIATIRPPPVYQFITNLLTLANILKNLELMHHSYIMGVNKSKFLFAPLVLKDDVMLENKYGRCAVIQLTCCCDKTKQELNATFSYQPVCNDKGYRTYDRCYRIANEHTDCTVAKINLTHFCTKL